MNISAYIKPFQKSYLHEDIISLEITITMKMHNLNSTYGLRISAMSSLNSVAPPKAKTQFIMPLTRLYNVVFGGQFAVVMTGPGSVPNAALEAA